MKKYSVLLLITCAASLQTAFPAALPNAWQISDNSTAAGTTLTYFTNLTAAQQLAATNAGGGWHYTVNARFLTNFGGPKTMAMAYGVGNKRWLVWLDLNGSGDLTAEIEGGIVYTLTANGTGNGLYHTHEIIYDPATARANYLFDGQVLTNNWAGSAFALTAGQVLWGAANAGGQGRMNVHSASFEVTGLSIVANYDAGTQNNPAVAPNPTTVGWSVNAGASTSSTNVSPDMVLLPVVTTLGPGSATSTTVQINGRVNPSSSSTTAWFEWGSDTNYGNLTAVQTINPGASNVTAMLTNLSNGPDYHYRLVATKGFGVVAGQDQPFNISFLSTPVGTPAGYGGRVVWGDYDRDGRLDFLETGAHFFICQVWRNSTSGFVDAGVPVSPVQQSACAWGDFDRDGYLDFILLGEGVGQVWHNTGSSLTNFPVPGLPKPLRLPSVAWGDYDNDGKLDFIMTATSLPLWRNTGSGFANVAIPGLQVAAAFAGSVAWGDFDNDGFLDFLITGGGFSELWHNGGGSFTRSAVPGLPGVTNSAAALGDYDNDGRLDFLLTGNSATGQISQLWRNTGTGFTNVPIPGLLGVVNPAVAWGDYDNDGQLDFFFSGLSTTGLVSQLWRNTGSGFANVPLVGLRGVQGGSVAWADYDNDGRLDFLMLGEITNIGDGTLLWRNNTSTTNAPPVAPSGLSATRSVNGITFNWNAATDDHTPSPGLTYNLRIGLTPGGSEILGAQALSNGFRLVPQRGNAGSRLTATYRLSGGRTYYWTVQAVDGAFAGSAFASEQQLVLPPILSQPVRLQNGSVQLSFNNYAPTNYVIFTTTNVQLPVTSWDFLGYPVTFDGIFYEFNDSEAVNHGRRFYILRSE